MKLNKYDCKEIINFLNIHKNNCLSILTDEFIKLDIESSREVLHEICKIDYLIYKLEGA